MRVRPTSSARASHPVPPSLLLGWNRTLIIVAFAVTAVVFLGCTKKTPGPKTITLEEAIRSTIDRINNSTGNQRLQACKEIRQYVRGQDLEALGLPTSDPKRKQLTEAAHAALLNAVKDPSQQIRYLAALTIVDLGVDRKAAVPALIDEISESEQKKKMMGLGGAGPEGSALAASEPFIEEALKAIAAVGSDAEDAVPSLLELLNAGVRYRLVADVILRIGKPSVPALKRVIENEPIPKLLRVRAAGLLGALQPEPNIVDSILIPALSDREGQIRSDAVVGLELTGPAAKTAFPRLLQIHIDLTKPAPEPTGPGPLPKSGGFLVPDSRPEMSLDDIRRALWSIDPDQAKASNVPMPVKKGNTMMSGTGQ